MGEPSFHIVITANYAFQFQGLDRAIWNPIPIIRAFSALAVLSCLERFRPAGLNFSSTYSFVSDLSSIDDPFVWWFQFWLRRAKVVQTGRSEHIWYSISSECQYLHGPHLGYLEWFGPGGLNHAIDKIFLWAHKKRDTFALVRLIRRRMVQTGRSEPYLCLHNLFWTACAVMGAFLNSCLQCALGFKICGTWFAQAVFLQLVSLVLIALQLRFQIPVWATRWIYYNIKHKAMSTAIYSMDKERSASTKNAYANCTATGNYT